MQWEQNAPQHMQTCLWAYLKNTHLSINQTRSEINYVWFQLLKNQNTFLERNNKKTCTGKILATLYRHRNDWLSNLHQKSKP